MEDLYYRSEKNEQRDDGGDEDVREGLLYEDCDCR